MHTGNGVNLLQMYFTDGMVLLINLISKYTYTVLLYPNRTLLKHLSGISPRLQSQEF